MKNSKAGPDHRAAGAERSIVPRRRRCRRDVCLRGMPLRITGSARRIQAGQVDINGQNFNPLAPFGGYKQSGHGRELGKYGLEEYLETKSMQMS